MVMVQMKISDKQSVIPFQHFLFVEYNRYENWERKTSLISPHLYSTNKLNFSHLTFYFISFCLFFLSWCVFLISCVSVFTSLPFIKNTLPLASTFPSMNHAICHFQMHFVIPEPAGNAASYLFCGGITEWICSLQNA